MKLTIEQVSKLTKLSIPTLRVYVSRQKLGTKVGNNRFFSQADVQKLLKGSRRTGGAESKTTTKAPARKAKTAKAAPRAKSAAPRPAAAKPAAAKQAAAKPLSQKAPAPRTEKPELKTKPVRPSFWSRLFGARGPKQKINVLEAKSTK